MERVTDVPGSLVQPADPAQANDYDSFAEAYSAETEDNIMNGYYARPAIIALAGDVAGRRILDAGCGSGPLSAALRDRGAVVTGIDASAGMLALARRRLGDDAALHLVDLDYAIQDPRPDYFATTSYTDEWTFNGQSFPMSFWRRPLHAMTDAFTTAGFRLAVISEPQPDPAARELFPDDFHDFSTKISLLFFVVEVPPSAAGSDD